MTTGDLGVLGDLATALGIMRGGSADPDWFGDPGERLATVLSDDVQRGALVSFLDTVLDDGDVDTDDQGRTFVPLVKQIDPDVTVGVVVTPAQATVDIGLRVDVATDAVTGAQARPGTTSSLEITLFRTGRGNVAAPDPVLLLGQPGGRIRLQTRLDLDPSPPGPDDFHLGGIGLQVDVPTAPTGDEPPAIALTLTQLQLPGGAPQDFDLGVGSAAELERTVVELVLGLVRALAPNDTGPLNAVARVLGLTDDLPPLPVDQMLTEGLPALTAWLEGVLSDPTSRATWLAAIVDLLPAGAAVDGDADRGGLRGGDVSPPGAHRRGALGQPAGDPVGGGRGRHHGRPGPGEPRRAGDRPRYRRHASAADVRGMGRARPAGRDRRAARARRACGGAVPGGAGRGGACGGGSRRPAPADVRAGGGSRPHRRARVPDARPHLDRRGSWMPPAPPSTRSSTGSWTRSATSPPRSASCSGSRRRRGTDSPRCPCRRSPPTRSAPCAATGRR